MRKTIAASAETATKTKSSSPKRAHHLTHRPLALVSQSCASKLHLQPTHWQSPNVIKFCSCCAATRERHSPSYRKQPADIRTAPGASSPAPSKRRMDLRLLSDEPEDRERRYRIAEA